jgi:hypothetical protein
MTTRLLLLFALFPATWNTAAEVPARPAEDEEAEIAAGKSKLPGLKLELLTPKKQYELGEPIEVTMRYTYTGDRKLAVEHVTYDRCGRILDFGFRAVDGKGGAVRDPIGNHLGGMCGGLRGSGPLAPGKPYEQKAQVNEWLCFDAPGRYTITALSRIVSFDPHGTGRSWNGPNVPLEGEPLAIEITAPVDAHRLERIARAKASLAGASEDARHQAMRDLRFLVDDRAIPLLVKGLEDPFGNVVVEARFGLLAFRDMAPVKAEILKRLDDEKHVLNLDNLWKYAGLLAAADLRAQGRDAAPASAEGRKEYREALKRWEDLLKEKCLGRMKELPPVQAAEQTVDGMAIGPTVSRSDLANWKLIIEHVGAMSDRHKSRVAYLIERDCRDKALMPDLKKLPANGKLPGEVRSAAIIALHEMGDDSFRDLLVADLAKPKYAFSYAAHGTLGDYKANEIAQGLLRLVDSVDYVPRRTVAERLRDFSAPLAVEDLRAACQRLAAREGMAESALIEALAMKSPEDAFPFIRDYLHDPIKRDHQDRGHAIGMLCRMDLPAAQELLLEIFRTEAHGDREQLAWQLAASWENAERAKAEAGQPRSVEYVPRRLPASREIAGAFFPELLMLYRGDPSGKVQDAARRALVRITGIPRQESGPVTAKQEAEWVPQWEAWWRKNRACFGRWGRVRHGIALKASADKGEYQVGDPIRLTLRFRRESGELPLLPRVRLQGYFFEPGQSLEDYGKTFDYMGVPIELPVKGPEPLLAQAPRSEATFCVDAQGLAKFDRPGTYRLHVRYVLDEKVGFWRQDIIEAHPITITIPR